MLYDETSDVWVSVREAVALTARCRFAVPLDSADETQTTIAEQILRNILMSGEVDVLASTPLGFHRLSLEDVVQPTLVVVSRSDAVELGRFPDVRCRLHIRATHLKATLGLADASSTERCRAWLKKAMATSSPRPKPEMRSEASRAFNVGRKTFDNLWRELAAETGPTAWTKPGRRPKPT